jgi:photosystem II PsbY protein
MAATIAASKVCFTQLAFSGASTSKAVSTRLSRPVVLPRRNVTFMQSAIRASSEVREAQASTPSVSNDSLHASAGTALAASLFSMLATSPSANAAQEVMQLATDARPALLLFPLAAAIGWVLFNILQPGLNQFNKMRGVKAVAGGLGLGAAASLFATPSADAAQEFAQLAEGSDYRPLILLVILGPAIGWVLFNILQPALRQFDNMNKKRSIVGFLGLGAAASALAMPTSADAAQEFAQLAEGTDSRPLILLLVLAPALGWVAFNILKPALRQLEQAINKSK